MQKNRRSLFIPFLILAAMAGGVVFLMYADIPAPRTPVEKQIPNDQFLK